MTILTQENFDREVLNADKLTVVISGRTGAARA